MPTSKISPDSFDMYWFGLSRIASEVCGENREAYPVSNVDTSATKGKPVQFSSAAACSYDFHLQWPAFGFRLAAYLLLINLATKGRERLARDERDRHPYLNLI